MRAAFTVVVGVVVFVGCSTGVPTPPASAPTATTRTAPAVTAPAAPTPPPAGESVVVSALPAVPSPQRVGDCPYLSAADVAAFNGERVATVQLDSASNPPACFFDQGDGHQLLSTWVFRALSPAVAAAVVDRAAPVASTSPADQPLGWSGGSTGGSGGAVYAVSKGEVAVVVTTNQGQSVKARRVAEQIIATLRL